MSKIIDIYKNYKIMPILVKHQLRAAAVAMQICESIDYPVDKESIILACLLHDMGNIIKFNLNYFPEENNPEGLEYWMEVKNDYILKYGSDEHLATAKIAKELMVKDTVISFISAIDFGINDKNINNLTLDKKICIYADSRVSPHGVVSIKERLLEVKKRYKNHPNPFDDETHLYFEENIKNIEDSIFSYLSIRPEEINDESILINFKKLKNFEI